MAELFSHGALGEGINPFFLSNNSYDDVYCTYGYTISTDK